MEEFDANLAYIVKKEHFTMKKIIVSGFLAFAMALSVCTACGQGGGTSSSSHRMRTFLSLVAGIETPITLLSDAELQAGYIVYGYLSDAERGDSAVEESKRTLDAYKETFDTLKTAHDAALEAEREQARMRAFLEAAQRVPSVGALTLQDASLVDEALSAYEALSEQSRADREVSDARERLAEASAQIEKLIREAHLAAVQSAAEQFIASVDAFGRITSQSYFELLALTDAYEALDAEVKEFAGVAEAKQRLDKAMARCIALREAENVERFLGLVGSLSEVTLDSRSDITTAESLYELLSEESKADAEVRAAYDKLKDARARYNEIFRIAEQALIEQFLAAVDDIPADLSGVDISWFDVLSRAETAYFALAYETTLRDDVKAAYERYSKARAAFDERGYKQIPAASFNIEYSGDNPPYLVMQNFVEKTAAVREFFGVSSNAELKEFAIAYLDVYADGVYAGKVEFDAGSLTNGFILRDVVSLLQLLAAENPSVVSGSSFSFCVHFEDRAGSFIPSVKSNVSKPTNKYIW